MKDFPTIVTIDPRVFLKIDNEKVLDFAAVVSTNSGTYFEMNVENNGRLILNPLSQIVVRNKNLLKLANNSKLYLGNEAEILVEQGGQFCNLGASIRGNGRIIYVGGPIHHIQCNSLADYLVKDSTQFILDSNAVWEIPDSTTLNFVGNRTDLIMKPGSKLKWEWALKFYSIVQLRSLQTVQSFPHLIQQNCGMEYYFQARELILLVIVFSVMQRHHLL